MEEHTCEAKQPHANGNVERKKGISGDLVGPYLQSWRTRRVVLAHAGALDSPRPRLLGAPTGVHVSVGVSVGVSPDLLPIFPHNFINLNNISNILQHL